MSKAVDTDQPISNRSRRKTSLDEMASPANVSDWQYLVAPGCSFPSSTLDFSDTQKPQNKVWQMPKKGCPVGHIFLYRFHVALLPFSCTHSCFLLRPWWSSWQRELGSPSSPLILSTISSFYVEIVSLLLTLSEINRTLFSVLFWHWVSLCR